MPAPFISNTSPPNPAAPAISWANPERERAFHDWLTHIAPAQRLVPHTLRSASTDASFRRYFRVGTLDGPDRIIMDAPPEHENSAPFVSVASTLQRAGLNVPQILVWDAPKGFMLLSDLGANTMLEAINAVDADKRRNAAHALYLQALDVLVPMQKIARPPDLPTYDRALLGRELNLFRDWYVERHRGIAVEGSIAQVLTSAFDLILDHVLRSPCVFVHRDFMPRNLMLGPKTALPCPLGVLDFQDAVWGPVTYDIACLMRDAFISWDEELVLDITVRYWERARGLGLMEFEDWSTDFASFWRAVEWMGIQRHLKVAGIFARITLRDGKPQYLADAPRFIDYIRHTAARYRELGPLLRLIDRIEGDSAQTTMVFGRL